MPDYEILLRSHAAKLLKAIVHLDYSFHKVQHLPAAVDDLDDQALETWESFAARFARVSDLFLARYLRTYVLVHDPAFSGSLRDFVNEGEKLGLVDDAAAWLRIRALRNMTAHDYTEDDLCAFFNQLRQECPRLLMLHQRLHSDPLADSSSPRIGLHEKS